MQLRVEEARSEGPIPFCTVLDFLGRATDVVQSCTLGERAGKPVSCGNHPLSKVRLTKIGGSMWQGGLLWKGSSLCKEVMCVSLGWSMRFLGNGEQGKTEAGEAGRSQVTKSFVRHILQFSQRRHNPTVFT